MLQSSIVNSIHQFWFGAHSNGTLPLANVRLWFCKETAKLENAHALAYVEHHFLAQIESASSGGLAEWQCEDRGSLALILLLEQFPRLLGGEHALLPGCQRYALRYCKAGLLAGLGDRLMPAELCCFYSPLMTSPNMVDRQRGIGLLEQLLADTSVSDHPHHEQRDLVRSSLFEAIERNAIERKTVAIHTME